MKIKRKTPSKALLLIPVAFFMLSGSAIAYGYNKVSTPDTQTTYNKVADTTGHKDVSGSDDKTAEAKDKQLQAKAAKAKKAQDAAAAAKTQASAQAAAAAASMPPKYTPIAPPSPRGKPLYVAPAQAGRPSAITSQSVGTWLGGWSGDVRAAANAVVTPASAQGALATLVLYNIPARDCGSHSAGGAGSSAAYRAWVRQVAAGIGNREAIVIVEPDALPQITDCLTPAQQAARYADISDAVNVLATTTKAFVYLDAGNSTWVDSTTMSQRLLKANILQARGVSINVSGFESTATSTAFGNRISAATGKQFVIDTSRNGNGSNGEWCNPKGRALGAKPTTSAPGNTDAYLWIKQPGESDGTCNGGPSAGEWWNEYAQELVKNAGY